MFEEEFQFEMQKMVRFFGKKLNDDQLEIWFEKCGGLDLRDFKKAISQAISSEKTFPTPSVVTKLSADARASNVGTDGGYIPVPCHECKGTGFLSIDQHVNDKVLKYAYRCTCPNGQRLSVKIPFFNSQQRKVA